KEFHTTVAKLLYLAKRARVDILLPIAFLSTRVKSPTSQDADKLMRVLKYLNGTVENVLVLRPSSSMELEGYIDAAFGCHPDGKSHTGLVVTLAGCTVLCMSSKQKLVTRDSTESELVGLSDKLMNVIQCHDFLVAQGVECGVPKIYQDNTSTITLVTKGGGKYRTKYMRTRQAFVKERCDAGEVSVEYLPTQKMIADMMTKALQGVLFRVMTRRTTGQYYDRATGVRREK
uniref:Ty1/Copia family ribonuclease HI n=1 Tax=Phenylobacterium aquaticum TaxID=1763816 RepID=UPI0026F06B80